MPPKTKIYEKDILWGFDFFKPFIQLWHGGIHIYRTASNNQNNSRLQTSINTNATTHGTTSPPFVMFAKKVSASVPKSLLNNKNKDSLLKIKENASNATATTDVSVVAKLRFL